MVKPSRFSDTTTQASMTMWINKMPRGMQPIMQKMLKGFALREHMMLTKMRDFPENYDGAEGLPLVGNSTQDGVVFGSWPEAGGGAYVGCMGSIEDEAVAAISLDMIAGITADYDPDSMFDTANGKILFPSTGWWEIHADIEIQTDCYESGTLGGFHYIEIQTYLNAAVSTKNALTPLIVAPYCTYTPPEGPPEQGELYLGYVHVFWPFPVADIENDYATVTYYLQDYLGSVSGFNVEIANVKVHRLCDLEEA